MKRFLLLAALLSPFVLTYAQCTPDNTITQPGVYPEQPDTAFVDQAYDFSFQILALEDTAVVFGGQPLSATIDSVKVDGVIGLPTSFSYQCNPASCTFTFEAVGCVNVKGNPVASQAGVYELRIATTAYARAGFLAVPVADTADGYQLIIKDNGTASISTLNTDILRIYPNPSTNGTFMVQSKEPLTAVRITDVQGKIIAYKSSKRENAISLDLMDSPRGIYLLQAEISGKSIVRRLVK